MHVLIMQNCWGFYHCLKCMIGQACTIYGAEIWHFLREVAIASVRGALEKTPDLQAKFVGLNPGHATNLNLLYN